VIIQVNPQTFVVLDCNELNEFFGGGLQTFLAFLWVFLRKMNKMAAESALSVFFLHDSLFFMEKRVGF
jgi:hypothetical protein